MPALDLWQVCASHGRWLGLHHPEQKPTTENSHSISHFNTYYCNLWYQNGHHIVFFSYEQARKQENNRPQRGRDYWSMIKYHHEKEEIRTLRAILLILPKEEMNYTLWWIHSLEESWWWTLSLSLFLKWIFIYLLLFKHCCHMHSVSCLHNQLLSGKLSTRAL